MIKKLIIFDFYKTIYNPDTGRLFYGMKDVLKRLSLQYLLALITTNSSQRRIEIKCANIASLFSKIIFCQQKSVKLFKKFIKESGCSFSSTIIIGDRIEEEIQIGKIMKLRTIQIKSEKENPVKTIRRNLIL